MTDVVEDTFILLDALEQDALVLRRSKPSLCVEIGSVLHAVSRQVCDEY